MDVKLLIDTAVPTPFGAIITQNEFDLAAILSFRSQLLSLSRAFGPAKAPFVADPTEVLVKVHKD